MRLAAAEPRQQNPMATPSSKVNHSRAAALLLAFALASCGGSDQEAQQTGSGEFSFLLNGTKVKSDVWTCARFTSAGDVNITSNMHRDSRTLLFNIGAPSVGKRIVLGGVASGNYAAFFTKFGDPTTACEVKEGWIEFSEWNEPEKFFSATFELSATSPSGELLSITQGRISGGKIGEDQLID